MPIEDYELEITNFYIFTPMFTRHVALQSWTIETLNGYNQINAAGPCLVVNEHGVVYANQKLNYRHEDEWVRIGKIDISKIISHEKMSTRKETE